MAPRPIGPFLETPGSYGRRPHTLFWVFTLIFVVVVVIAVFKVIPQGPVEAISDRQARKKLTEAAKLESQSLNYFAAEIYNNIVDSSRVSSDLRVKAARGLERVNRLMPGHAEAVVAALEKAYYFSAPGPDKDALRDELEQYAGHPLNSVTPAGAARPTTGTQAAQPATPPGAGAGRADALPPKDRALARVGGQLVGRDEIYKAWIQFNGQRQPTSQELERFIKAYLDMVLLAGEASHRGLDGTADAYYYQRIHRIYYLSNTLTEKMIGDLKTPDAKTLEDYYKAHLDQFMTPARAVVGHIVASKDGAAKVARALSQGQKFDRVARQYSLDADQAQNGAVTDTVTQNDPGLPAVGPNPQLVGRLLELDAGVTTGPLESPRGPVWLHIVQKTPARQQAFAEVRDNVMFSYQKQQLALSRAALLRQLRRQTPVEPLDPSMRNLIVPEPAAPAATSATLAATGATTPTATASAPGEPTSTTQPLAATPAPPQPEAASSPSK